MGYWSDAKEDRCEKCDASLYNDGNRIGAEIRPVPAHGGGFNACECVLVLCGKCSHLNIDFYIIHGVSFEAYCREMAA